MCKHANSVGWGRHMKSLSRQDYKIELALNIISFFVFRNCYMCKLMSPIYCLSVCPKIFKWIRPSKQGFRRWALPRSFFIIQSLCDLFGSWVHEVSFRGRFAPAWLSLGGKEARRLCLVVHVSRLPKQRGDWSWGSQVELAETFKMDSSFFCILPMLLTRSSPE